MENCSDRSSGKIVVARVHVDGHEYAVVAVEPEAAADRILAAKTIRHYANRLFNGLPVILACRDGLGRSRFLGGSAADSLQRSEPILQWKTLYEDAPDQAEPAA